MTDITGTIVLDWLLSGRDLRGNETEAFIGMVMDGEVPATVVAAVLAALRLKGETSEEVAAAARAMRVRSIPVPIAEPAQSVDTCGTGGDGAHTLNISTGAALAAAAAGVSVAKHGNRSVSSSCGSADVLERLGVRIELDGPALARLHDQVGIAFLFAPRLHPAMRAVVPVRRELGVRTIFNLLGPLTNPAGVGRQVVGVWGSDVQDLMADALAGLDAIHALVVHSEDGLDELSVAAPSRVVEVRSGEVHSEWIVDPKKVGVRHNDMADLRGGDVVENAARLRRILDGDEESAASEAVALNAGAALVVAGVVDRLEDGLERARRALEEGGAGARLDALIRASKEAAGDA